MDLSEFDKEVEKEIAISATKECERLLTDLKANTPVDTGNAMRSWELKKDKKDFVIVNNVEYIDDLNRGSSRQAPAHFVENTALRYGMPSGTIVEYTK